MGNANRAAAGLETVNRASDKCKENKGLIIPKGKNFRE